ncbi:MAG: phosphate transporter substrate-binding protein [Verrucomicrobia bacterium]|nr:phosphate transporter substrate-binding protein [Verrucomicrobiota bacterium]
MHTDFDRFAFARPCLTKTAAVRRRSAGIWLGLAAAVILATPARAKFEEALAALPPYKAERAVDGRIRVPGFDAKLQKLWAKGFLKFQPNVTFDDKKNFPRAGFETGDADIGIRGREIWPIEIGRFMQAQGGEIIQIVACSAAFDKTDFSPAPVIFVNKDNPITGLTMKQLDGIYGEQANGGWAGNRWSEALARSAKDNIRTWGQLGLTGEWADKLIRPYGYDLVFSGTRGGFQRMVLKGRDKWNPNLIEIVGVEPTYANMFPEGVATNLRSGQKVLAALSTDKYGIGYSAFEYSQGDPTGNVKHVGEFRDVKVVPVAAAEGGPYVEASEKTCQNRTYPLIRDIWILIARPQHKPIDSNLREFVRYILSREGQAAVVEDGSYLPLTPELVQAGLKQLE